MNEFGDKRWILGQEEAVTIVEMIQNLEWEGGIVHAFTLKHAFPSTV